MSINDLSRVEQFTVSRILDIVLRDLDFSDFVADQLKIDISDIYKLRDKIEKKPNKS